MMRMHSNLILLAAAMAWGAGNASQKILLEHIGPFTAVGLRCVIAALVIAPFAWNEKPRTGSSPEKSLLAVVTIGCFAVALTLYQIAFATTTVTNTGFLVNTCSVMTPIATWWILQKGPSLSVWPAAAMALGGIALMSGGAAVGLTLGDGLSLLSAVFYALWMVLLGEYVKSHGGSRRFTVQQLLATGVLGLVVAGATETVSLDGLWQAAPHLVFVGAVSTGVGYMLQAVAQQRTCANEASIIVSSEAIFGAIGGYLVFGDRLDATGYVGVVLIMAAIVVVELGPRLQFWLVHNWPVEGAWRIVDQ
jgi:drug/metabolite transporter (DMT)-like permease